MFLKTTPSLCDPAFDHSFAYKCISFVPNLRKRLEQLTNPKWQTEQSFQPRLARYAPLCIDVTAFEKKLIQGKKTLAEMALKTMSKITLGSAASILFQLLVNNMCTDILGLSRHGKQWHDRGSVSNASQALEFVFEVGSEEGDIDKERK